MSTITPTTVEQLKAIPLLQPLGDGVLNALRPHMYECTYAQGERILREGEYCDGAYYLLDGEVSVTFGGPPAVEPRRGVGSATGESDSSVILAEMPVSLEPGGRAILKAGDIFGEGSALSR